MCLFVPHQVPDPVYPGSTPGRRASTQVCSSDFRRSCSAKPGVWSRFAYPTAGVLYTEESFEKPALREARGDSTRGEAPIRVLDHRSTEKRKLVSSSLEFAYRP